MGLSKILQSSTAMQKVLSAASTASIFLPWVQISLFMSTTSMNLLSLILSWDIRSHILMCLGGVLFIAGSLALFIWKKAPLLQVAGLILVPLGFMTLAVDAGAGTVSYGEAFQALQMFTGVGVYAGWAAAICGVMFMLLGWPTPRFLQGASIFPPRGLRGGEASVPAVHCRPAPLVPVRAALPPMSFPAAIEMAERHLAGGDLNAALTWYGRALGISRDDEERAISKVRIASVLNSLGKEWEAQMFIDEAKQIDPEDVSGWSVPLPDTSWPMAPRAWEA